MNIDGSKLALPSDDSETVRVVCVNHECEHHGTEREYDANYRQHTIALCGGCGGELHELLEDEAHEPGAKFRRVRLHRPHLAPHDPQMKGLTAKERADGWEIHAMIGKVAPPEANP